MSDRNIFPHLIFATSLLRAILSLHCINSLCKGFIGMVDACPTNTSVTVASSHTTQSLPLLRLYANGLSSLTGAQLLSLPQFVLKTWHLHIQFDNPALIPFVTAKADWPHSCNRAAPKSRFTKLVLLMRFSL